VGAAWLYNTREECEKKQVTIHEALDVRLTNIANQETTHGEVIAKGKLDLYNTELRDSHMAALAETLIAFPIARTVSGADELCPCFGQSAAVIVQHCVCVRPLQIRLSRNHVTDAGMAALIDVLKYQMEQGESPEGAGGVRKLKMTKKVKGFGAVLSETAAAAEESRLERQEMEMFNNAQALAAQLDDAMDGGGSFGESAVSAIIQASLTDNSSILPKEGPRGTVASTAEGPLGLPSLLSDRTGAGKTVTSTPGPKKNQSATVMSATAIDSLLGRSHTESLFPSTSSHFPGSSLVDSRDLGSEDEAPVKQSDNINVKFRKQRSNKPKTSVMGVPSRLDTTKMIGPIV
jgi:hypothetical protein